MKFTVHDVLRIPNWPNIHGWRVWKVIEVLVGSLGQEGVYILQPLDMLPADHQICIPILFLESHPQVEKV